MNTMADKETLISEILKALKEDGYDSELSYLKLSPAKKGLLAEYERDEPATDYTSRDYVNDGYIEVPFEFKEQIKIHEDLDCTVLEVRDFLEYCQAEILKYFD